MFQTDKNCKQKSYQKELIPRWCEGYKETFEWKISWGEEVINSCLHVLVNYGGNRGKGLSLILREKRNTTQPKKQQLSPIRKILGWLIQYLTVQYTVQYSIRCIWVLNAGEKLIFKILKLFFSSLPGVWNKKVYETGNYYRWYNSG